MNESDQYKDGGSDGQYTRQYEAQDEPEGKREDDGPRNDPNANHAMYERDREAKRQAQAAPAHTPAQLYVGDFDGCDTGDDCKNHIWTVGGKHIAETDIDGDIGAALRYAKLFAAAPETAARLAQAVEECDQLRSATYKANKRADETRAACDALAAACKRMVASKDNKRADLEIARAALAQWEEAKK